MSRPRKERLGKGLGALLGDYLEEKDTGEKRGEVRTLPVDRIRPNPFQPRRDFSEEEMEELARSIRENGLLQPLTVRPAPGKEEAWELVAGERRLRAVLSLEWSQVPALVREVDDQTLLVLAMVENLQREALGPLEEAEGFRVLSETFHLTQGEIAQAVGKNRSTVANTLRLLQLPPSVRKLLESGDLTSGHARALLPVEDPVRAGALARKAVQEEWSVRKMEEAVRGTGSRGEAASSSPPRPPKGRDPVVSALEEELRGALGTRVVVQEGKEGRGTIAIPFRDTEDFERVFALLTGKEVSEVVS